MSVSAISLEELAPVFAGRPHLADLWQLISEGRSDLTPEHEVELAFAEMRAYEQRGDMPTMLKRIEEALELALRAGYRDGVAYAYYGLAYFHMRLGNYTRSAEMARASLACDDRTVYSGIGWRVLAFCAQNANDWTAAQEYYERGIRAMRETVWRPGLIGILADSALFYRDRGLFELALSTVSEVERLAGETSNYHWFAAPFLVGIYVQIGRRAEARLARDQARSFSTSSRLTEMFYWAFAARLMLDEDDYEGAAESLQNAKALAEAQGAADMLLQIRLDYSRLRRLQADAPGALVWANDALAFARSLTCRFYEGNALVARARAWWQLDNPAAAETDLLAALDITNMLGAQYLAAETTFLLAALRRQQNHAEAESTWLDAARRIRTGGYGFMLERERELAFPLVAACAHSRNPRVRKSAESLLEQLARVAPLPLHVRGLGQFEVRQGRRELSRRELERRKAGELLAFLLLQPERTATRDVLGETLWPESSPELVQERLHQATSILRRALEPDLPVKFPSRYLRVEGGRLQLVPPPGSTADWTDFERQVEHAIAEQDAAALEQGLSLYQGELFPALRYADWSALPRERLAQLELRGLLALAKLELAANRNSEALALCQRLLRREPWQEEAVLVGMRACVALNDRVGALHLYRALDLALQAELNASPRHDLTALAESLRS